VNYWRTIHPPTTVVPMDCRSKMGVPLWFCVFAFLSVRAADDDAPAPRRAATRLDALYVALDE
jgi:hypothetical protein